jgi:glycosyltransferase 2 family protein
MRPHLRTGLILVVTVALLAFFLRSANLGAVWAELRRADAVPIVGSVLAMAVVYALRAVRWQFLLRPIGGAGFGIALRATVIGFAISALLPARPGEAVRPYLLARREGLSFTSVLATILIERILDLSAVLLLFASFVLLFDPGMQAADARLYDAVKLGGTMAAVVALATLALMSILAGHPARLGRMVLAVQRVLPAKFVHALARVFERFAGGLAATRNPRDIVTALALSMPVWLAIAASVWLVTRAFHMTVPFTGSFLLMTLLVVGIAVPTPGGVGGFHEAFRIGATAFYGVNNDRAVGCAIALHASQFVPVVIAGLVFMAQEGLTFGSVSGLAAQPRPTPDGDTGSSDTGQIEESARRAERGVAGAGGAASAEASASLAEAQRRPGAPAQIKK